MKRLMTTLFFVLLGWTGLCLADGVTVSGTVDASAMRNPAWDVSNFLLLSSNGTVAYIGSATGEVELNTTYSFADVVPGTYTLRFEGYAQGRVVIREETSVEVPAGGLTDHNITVSNSDMGNATHVGIQFTVKNSSGTGIAGATVTCSRTSLVSDQTGKVTFFLAQSGFPYTFTATAAGYQEASATLQEIKMTSEGYPWMEGNEISMADAASVQYVTLSGAITMAPEGTTFPTGVQLQLETTKGSRYPTLENNQYSQQGVAVGEVTLSLYDPNNIYEAGKVYNYAITSPENGQFTVTGTSETFTQNITVTKVAANVQGTIKNGATFNPQPTVTLTKTGETTFARSATATGGAFRIQGVKPGTYTVGVTLAGYQLKGEKTVTVEETLADVKLTTPLELEAADVEIKFTANSFWGFRPEGGEFITFDNAVVQLFAEGADVTTATPLATATADASGKFTLTTTGKIGTKYILYVTHEKIRPAKLEVTVSSATINVSSLNFNFELAPETIPTPTFTPERGKIAPGTTINFTLPESLDIEGTYNDMAFILYVENNTTVELKSDVATLMAAITPEMGGEPMAEGDGMETDPAGALPFKVGMYREGDWLIPVTISDTAKGGVTLRAVLAVSEDMETLLYSNEMQATYTVEGEVVKPTAPTFYLGETAITAATATVAKDEEVTLSNGYAATTNPIYYVIDGEDAAFSSLTTLEALSAATDKTIFAYTEPLVIDQSQTIKAATAAIKGQTFTWSDIVTVEFTVEDEEDPGQELPATIKAPTFVPAAGAVDKGTKLRWTWDEAYNDYMGIGVVYVANGTDADLDIDAEKYEELYDAEEEGSDDGKVYIYLPAEEGGPAELGAYVINKNVTVKARLVIPTVNQDEEVIIKLSPVATATYTIKGGTTDPETDTVATPTFSVAAGEVEAGTKVEIACVTDSAKIYYTVDGSEPTAESTEYKEAVVIDKSLTLKAIAFVGEDKSAVAEAAYTVKTANEGLELLGVSVYPNPSDGVFTLDLPVAARVEVFGLTGVVMQRIEAGAGLMTLNIDRSGIYFLRITADGRSTVKRVVVR